MKARSMTFPYKGNILGKVEARSNGRGVASAPREEIHAHLAGLEDPWLRRTRNKKYKVKAKTAVSGVADR